LNMLLNALPNRFSLEVSRTGSYLIDAALFNYSCSNSLHLVVPFSP
jgi:hypothetical protein